MERKDQVCSLELAKKLKELGVVQDSLFYWSNVMKSYKFEDLAYPYIMDMQAIDVVDHKIDSPIDDDYDEIKIENIKCYSAFTGAELGEILPQKIWIDENNCYFLRIMKDQGRYLIAYMRQNPKNGWEWDNHVHFEEDKEADARAKMVIFLLENNILIDSCF